MAERFEFKSEARQLLDLMIHSLYSNKEIFLRELVSNASDALDRLRVEALRTEGLVPSDHAYEIAIETDAAKRTLTIRDGGMGMSRAEMIENLGTIAHSGTKEFAATLAAAKGDGEEIPALIGQFGVGFYSAFMAAERVEVVSRRAGEDGAAVWSSSGDGTFSVDDASREACGTTITLHLREADPDGGLPDFTSSAVARRTIKRYSDFVSYPIKLRTVRVAKDDETGDAKETVEWETVNSRRAIWTRPESEVEDAEYAELYRHLSHDWRDPRERIRLKGEGTFEFDALLFLPSEPPFDFHAAEVAYGLQLYVKRVLVLDRCEELLPRWLRFVRGVVESPDLSLNVSREILQHDRRLTTIRRRVVKKVLETLATLRDEKRDDYVAFWRGFGSAIKEGMIEDHDRRAELADLLLFASSHDAEAPTTLREYVGRMKEGQEALYYATGPSRAAVERSPHLESLFARGYEVLFLVDPIDEFLVHHFTEYDGRELKAAGRGEVELGTEEERRTAEEARKKRAEEHRSLLDAIRDVLAEHVKEVRFSTRLTESPACLVGAEEDLSPRLERILEEAGQLPARGKRILELNPDHAVLAKLTAMHAEDPNDPRLAEWAELLYGQSLLAEGSPLPDPAAFARRVTALMVG